MILVIFFGYDCTIGDWSVSSHDKTIQLNNHGIKLVARYDEGLLRVVFDTETHTVRVHVTNPTLPSKCPRIADLSDNEAFFEELRSGLEEILFFGGFNSVLCSSDRTVFEIGWLVAAGRFFENESKSI